MTTNDAIAITPLWGLTPLWGVLTESDVDTIQNHLMLHEVFAKPLQSDDTITVNMLLNGICARLRHKAIYLHTLLNNDTQLVDRDGYTNVNTIANISTPNTQNTDIFEPLDYVDSQSHTKTSIPLYSQLGVANQIKELDLQDIYTFVERFIAY